MFFVPAGALRAWFLEEATLGFCWVEAVLLWDDLVARWDSMFLR